MRDAYGVGRRLSAVGLVLCAMALTGCGDTSGVVDAGQKISAPPAPEPLWSVAPIPEEPLPEGISLRNDPLEGLTAPAGAAGLDPKAVIAKDVFVLSHLQQATRKCREGCGLREPVLRDLTGDGRPELLLFIDPDPRDKAALGEGEENLDSGLYVYWVRKGRVHRILTLHVIENTHVQLEGRVLVVRHTKSLIGTDAVQLQTDRYQWDDGSWTLDLTSSIIAPPSSPPPSRSSSPSLNSASPSSKAS